MGEGRLRLPADTRADMIPTDQPDLALEVFKTVIGKGSLLHTDGGTNASSPGSSSGSTSGNTTGASPGGTGAAAAVYVPSLAALLAVMTVLVLDVSPVSP